MQLTRERLIARLSEPGHLVIWASPGAGKSTLLGQWIAAVAETGPRVGIRDGRTASAAQFSPPALAELDVLVVDNADALPAEAREAVRRLLDDEGTPRLIVAGRSDPFPVSPARWMTTSELRTADLAFTRDEVDALLRVRGIELTAESTAQLQSRTAGWATGLALASHLFANSADADAVAREFSGDHRAIGDYLLGEVLGTLSETERTVLVRSAVRERLSPELAAALCGHPDADAVFDGLARRNLLVDRRPGGDVVFHPVLLAYLSAEARRSGEDFRRAHAVAARWFLAAGQAAEALAHAVASADPETAAAVLRVHGVTLTLRGVPGLRSAVESAAGAEPALAALFRRMAEAPYLAGSSAHARLEELDASSPARALVASVLAELWCASGGAAQPVAEVGTSAAGAEYAAAVAFADAVRARLAGRDAPADERAAALDELQRLVEFANDHGYPWLRAVAIESIVAGAVGTTGWRFAEGVIRSARERPLGPEALSSVAGSRLLLFDVALAYQRAEDLPEQVMRVLLSSDFGTRHPDIQRIARAIAMLDALAVAPTREALQRFDALVADTGGDPAFLSMVLVPWLSAASQQSNHPVIEDIVWRTHQAFGPTSIESRLAAFLVHPERADEMALRAALAEGAPTRDPLAVAHARLRLAVHAHLHGAVAKSMTDLTEAVMVAHHHGAVRPFLLFGGDALTLLSDNCARLGVWNTAGLELLGAARAAAGSDLPIMATLTPRERILLDELPVHQTIADIARRQQVSPNTVKSQLKSVYRKLGVDNRADAVTVGRSVGLIG